MDITIDSMIWIYNFDPRAPESKNIRSWLYGNDGALETYSKICLNTIIPLEVLHSISRNNKVDYTTAYNAVAGIISMKKVEIIDFDIHLLGKAMIVLGEFKKYGIGGRDASIIAVMKDQNINRIASHDKCILAIKDFWRIDPVFSPPLILKPGIKFDKTEFKKLSLIK